MPGRRSISLEPEELAVASPRRSTRIKAIAHVDSPAPKNEEKPAPARRIRRSSSIQSLNDIDTERRDGSPLALKDKISEGKANTPTRRTRRSSSLQSEVNEDKSKPVRKGRRSIAAKDIPAPVEEENENDDHDESSESSNQSRPKRRTTRSMSKSPVDTKSTKVVNAPATRRYRLSLNKDLNEATKINALDIINENEDEGIKTDKTEKKSLNSPDIKIDSLNNNSKGIPSVVIETLNISDLGVKKADIVNEASSSNINSRIEENISEEMKIDENENKPANTSQEETKLEEELEKIKAEESDEVEVIENKSTESDELELFIDETDDGNDKSSEETKNEENSFAESDNKTDILDHQNEISEPEKLPDNLEIGNIHKTNKTDGDEQLSKNPKPEINKSTNMENMNQLSVVEKNLNESMNSDCSTNISLVCEKGTIENMSTNHNENETNISIVGSVPGSPENITEKPAEITENITEKPAEITENEQNTEEEKQNLSLVNDDGKSYSPITNDTIEHFVEKNFDSPDFSSIKSRKHSETSPIKNKSLLDEKELQKSPITRSKAKKLAEEMNNSLEGETHLLFDEINSVQELEQSLITRSKSKRLAEERKESTDIQSTSNSSNMSVKNSSSSRTVEENELEAEIETEKLKNVDDKNLTRESIIILESDVTKSKSFETLEDEKTDQEYVEINSALNISKKLNEDSPVKKNESKTFDADESVTEKISEKRHSKRFDEKKLTDENNDSSKSDVENKSIRKSVKQDKIVNQNGNETILDNKKSLESSKNSLDEEEEDDIKFSPPKKNIVSEKDNFDELSFNEKKHDPETENNYSDVGNKESQREETGEKETDDSEQNKMLDNLLASFKAEKKRKRGEYEVAESTPLPEGKKKRKSIPDVDFTDSEEESRNEFLDDMASEGSEDTPSIDSNEIIDEGESVGSTESESNSDEEYENDSFVVDDEEDDRLLSGDDDDHIDAIDKSLKAKNKKKRIITITDSSDEDIDNMSMKPFGGLSPSSSVNQISSVDSDVSESVKIKNEELSKKIEEGYPIEEEQPIEDEESLIILDDCIAEPEEFVKETKDIQISDDGEQNKSLDNSKIEEKLENFACRETNTEEPIEVMEEKEPILNSSISLGKEEKYQKLLDKYFNQFTEKSSKKRARRETIGEFVTKENERKSPKRERRQSLNAQNIVEEARKMFEIYCPKMIEERKLIVNQKKEQNSVNKEQNKEAISEILAKNSTKSNETETLDHDAEPALNECEETSPKDNENKAIIKPKKSKRKSSVSFEINTSGVYVVSPLKGENIPQIINVKSQLIDEANEMLKDFNDSLNEEVEQSNFNKIQKVIDSENNLDTLKEERKRKKKFNSFGQQFEDLVEVDILKSRISRPARKKQNKKIKSDTSGQQFEDLAEVNFFKTPSPKKIEQFEDLPEVNTFYSLNKEKYKSPLEKEKNELIVPTIEVDGIIKDISVKKKHKSKNQTAKKDVADNESKFYETSEVKLIPKKSKVTPKQLEQKSSISGKVLNQQKYRKKNLDFEDDVFEQSETKTEKNKKQITVIDTENIKKFKRKKNKKSSISESAVSDNDIKRFKKSAESPETKSCYENISPKLGNIKMKQKYHNKSTSNEINVFKINYENNIHNMPQTNDIVSKPFSSKGAVSKFTVKREKSEASKSEYLYLPKYFPQNHNKYKNIIKPSTSGWTDTTITVMNLSKSSRTIQKPRKKHRILKPSHTGNVINFNVEDLLSEKLVTSVTSKNVFKFKK